MERAFTSLGAEFTVYDANFDTDLMIRTIDDLVSGHDADVLVLHNPDVGVLSTQIAAAQEAGIYTVVVNMISNQSADVFIGADVVSAAEDITARAVVDCEAKGKTKVAVIEGVGPDGFSLQFNEGIKPALDAAGIDIVSTVQSNWDITTANQLATTLLQQHGDDLCALMLPWDIIAVGAGQAIAAAEADGSIPEDSVGVYSLDGSADWCDSLRAGHVTASAAYDVPGIGTGAVLAVQSLFEIGEPPGTRRTVTYVPHVVVDADNVDSIASACYPGS
jgi:ribose transport system substrate-binding protein